MKILTPKSVPYLAALATAAALRADTVGYYTDGGPSGLQANAISASGNTPVQIVDIATFNFSSVQAVMINNADNSGFTLDLVLRQADLESYVFNGGHLVIHDRFVASPDETPASHLFLFGHPEIQVQRDFNNQADIDLLPDGVVAFPSLTNTSLDNGTSSSHGFGYATTLPGGSLQFLSRGGAPTEVVAFQYNYGLGSVYYSTIPLDYYLNQLGDPALQEAMFTMATDAVAAGLGQPAPVPEPSAYAVLAGTSLAGFGLWRRIRARKG